MARQRRGADPQVDEDENTEPDPNAPKFEIDFSSASTMHMNRVGRWAHLIVWSFSVPAQELATFSREADEHINEAMAADGLVLDLRWNAGGKAEAMAALVGRFLPEPIVLGASKPSSALFGLVELFAHLKISSRGPRFEGPVVVLTGANTASAAEIAARVLQREIGAAVVGERTIGAEAAIEHKTLPDGSLLTFGSMRLVDVRGRGLQRLGVIPDVAVTLTLQDVARLGVAEARADWNRRVLEAGIATLEQRAPREDGNRSDSQ